MTTERARKRAYGVLAVELTHRWPYIQDVLVGDEEALTHAFGTIETLRAASEVPLSPSGEAEEAAPKAPTGPLAFTQWCERCDAYRATLTATEPCPICGAQLRKDRPEASRPEAEEAGQGPPPSPAGQGLAAEEGPSPAPVPESRVTAVDSFCDEVMAWVNGGFQSKPEGASPYRETYQDHLFECPSCAENVRLRDWEESLRWS